MTAKAPERLSDEGTTRQIPCEIFSRVVGYYRPVQNWNEGKKQEFSERTLYRPESVHEEER